MAAGKKRQTVLRWIVFLVLILAVAGGVLWTRGYFEPKDPTAGLMTARAQRGDVEKTVLATGIIKPSSLVAVGSQVSGRITSLKVGLGDTVEMGDQIAEIDSTTQLNDLRTAQATLAQVKAQRVEKQADIDLAKLVLERQEKLSTQNATSIADLQSADADVKVAEAQMVALNAEVDAAEVAVETAQANLDYTKITAPISGTVLAIVNQEGKTVNAAQSAPTIVVLGDLTVMTVRAEISEADVVNVKEGQNVRFSIIGEPDKSYKSSLESIEPAPESITSDSAVSSDSTSSDSDTSAIYYNGIFHVDNPDGRLRTYMTAEVEIILGEADDVVTIPSTALKTQIDENTYKVTVVTSKRTLESREVKIGLDNKVNAEVTSGLQEGDVVVIGEATAASSSSSEDRRGPPPMGL